MKSSISADGTINVQSEDGKTSWSMAPSHFERQRDEFTKARADHLDDAKLLPADQLAAADAAVAQVKAVK